LRAAGCEINLICTPMESIVREMSSSWRRNARVGVDADPKMLLEAAAANAASPGAHEGIVAGSADEVLDVVEGVGFAVPLATVSACTLTVIGFWSEE
jgi:hypothetical protein